MTKFPSQIAAITLVLLLAMPAGADEITDQLDTARAEYDSGELRKAVQTLSRVRDLSSDARPGPTAFLRCGEPSL